MSLSHLIDSNVVGTYHAAASVGRRVFDILNKNSILLVPEICFKAT